ncbi:C-X-C motif chemokine 9-like [Gambusia affinis]|uniref:C-X-C motif chemokine 9-like n=1 Tax=Gambusia affinis TaxID=33528 RepID=UPI001CDBBAF3|nr:C-X-C motif chemokine 9-like [Gambusia affinis]
MKSAVQLIVLLAFVFLCSSSGYTITRCSCIKTIPTVRRFLVADVNEYKPSAICNKHEVIAIMKDNKQHCLDPKSDFTKRLLRDFAMKRTASTEKLSTTTTTTAATTKSAATSSAVRRQRH